VNNEVWWYATRAAGLMTWSTATASVIAGILLMVPTVRSRSGPWFDDMHRFLSSVSMIFLATHVGTLWLNSEAGFGWRDILVPGQSSWEPEAAAWGVIAAWALLAIHLTSLTRDKISEFVWRSIHVLAVLTVGAGTYHAWLGGTDAHSPRTWIVAGLGSVLVIALITIRIRSRDDTQPGRVFKDQEALLREMRDRLENLPMPKAIAPLPTVAESASLLPQRSSVDAPLPDRSPQLGSWVGPSTDDPFDDAGVDPFDPGVGLFEPATEEEEQRVESVDLSELPPFEEGTSPFGPAHPAVAAISIPVEPVSFDTPAPAVLEPVAAGQVVAPAGPPPLPEAAVDPVTGKPDESVYAAWLVEWLAYADRYGEETPGDPDRS